MSRTSLASDLIAEKRHEIAEAVVARLHAQQPASWMAFADGAREKSVRDAGLHLDYLAEALAVEDPTLFMEYAAWVKVVFNGLDFPADVMAATLQTLKDLLVRFLPKELCTTPRQYIDIALTRLEQAPSVLPGMIEAAEPLSGLAQQYLDALLAGQRQVASTMIMNAVKRGVPIKSIYQHVFQPVQWELGRLWQMNQVSVAQEHYCTAATQLIMSQLYPYLFGGERNGRKLIATCIEAELHEIGVRMVADYFEMAGWDTYYLGANVPTDSILQTVVAQRADVLAISATIPTHTSSVRRLIAAVRESSAAADLKILVGGYPFNVAPDLWRSVGADGSARNADEAVQIAAQMLGV